MKGCFVAKLCAIIAWIKDSNNLNALSTSVIAVFTIVLTAVSYWQARLIRKEFVATHRPRVIIRFIQGPNYGEDSTESIWITVANIGDSEGAIVEFGGDLARRNKQTKIWLVPGADGGSKKIRTIRLKSGARHVFTVTAKKPYTDMDILGDATDTYELCAFGVIRYQDATGILRETGFFRVYDADSESFVPSNKQEDEYQD
jgi:hypothetical protein